MTIKFARFFTILLLTFSGVAMMAASFDAEARRFGGARSFGRQSTNIMKQRQAVKPPTAAQRNAAASNRAANTANTQARSGMSRWLGPIAGIAAGLGIAALLSAFGLSGAFLEFMSSLILIGLVIFAIMFIIRRLRGHGLATENAGHMRAQTMQRQGIQEQAWQQPEAAPAATNLSAATHDDSWFIPENFDTPGFLANAKAQFIKIQSLWDSGDINQLREYLTDDMLIEITPELEQRTGANVTEVLLLNAELMGMEAVAGGHLASIRYSGMLKESPEEQAKHFEEVWNLYKTDSSGWLLAGIQQLPSSH